VSERSNDEQARDPAALEGATAEEREGMDLLGRESVRDGAIDGVSGVGGIPGLRREAYRKNPPAMDDVNNMAGDLSQSGGVAGGSEEGPPGAGGDEAR
jgi:hypothetical protein